MKKSYAVAGLGALMAVSAFSTAQADERWPRWYVGLTGGYTFMQDEDVSGGTTATKIKPGGGWGAGGSIGYLPSSSIPVLNAMRFEAEVTYHENSVNSISRTNGSVGGHGNYRATAYMANAFYDLPLHSQWSPYIGAGAGYATIDLPTGNGIGNTSSSDTEFAYQFLAGIGYSPVSIPNTQWTLGYRYFATSDPKFNGPGSNIKTEYSTNSVELGAKFRF